MVAGCIGNESWGREKLYPVLWDGAGGGGGGGGGRGDYKMFQTICPSKDIQGISALIIIHTMHKPISY